MTEIVPLETREKRLKSLDEFEPPPWTGLDKGHQRRSRISLVLLVFAGLAIGAVIGLALPI
jgi:hypothetical protein